MAKKKSPKKKASKRKPSKPVTFKLLQSRLKTLLDSIPQVQAKNDPVIDNDSYPAWNDSNSGLRRSGSPDDSKKKKPDDIDRLHDILRFTKALIGMLPTALAQEALARLRDFRKKHFILDRDNVEYNVDKVIVARPNGDPDDFAWPPNRYLVYDSFADDLSDLLDDLNLMHPNMAMPSPDNTEKPSLIGNSAVALALPPKDDLKKGEFDPEAVLAQLLPSSDRPVLLVRFLSKDKGYMSSADIESSIEADLDEFIGGATVRDAYKRLSVLGLIEVRKAGPAGGIRLTDNGKVIAAMLEKEHRQA